MATWKGKSRGNILGYKIFITLLKYLGLPPAYFMLRFVALYFFFFTPASFRNILLCLPSQIGIWLLSGPSWPFTEIIMFSARYCSIKQPPWPDFDTKFTFDFDGEDHLRKMAAGKYRVPSDQRPYRQF